MSYGRNIPGYTGFIPFKAEFFGQTTGSSNLKAEIINRHAIETNSFKTTGHSIMQLQQNGSVHRRSSSVLNEDMAGQKTMILGNRSRDAKTWINGPTHEIRNQCLPGYTGFIPGVKAENIFSTTYAANTARSFANQIPKGHIGSPAERYTSLQAEKFSTNANRRILEDPNQALRRDYIEYTISENFRLKN